MKKFKKIMALVIAMAMVLSMSLTAFADGAASDYKITITNAVEGHTYTAYQIFAGTKASKDATDDVLGDITWGDGINETGKGALATKYGVDASDAKAAQKISEKIISGENPTADDKDDAAVAFADTVGTNVVAAKGHTGTLSGTTYTINNLPAGYYMIVDSYTPATGEVEGKDYTISRYMLQVVGDTSVVNKADKPTVDKNIDGSKDQDGKVNTDTKVNSTNIGDSVPYKVTSKVPEMTGYESYYFVLNDTMTEGLTFNDDVVVKIGSKTLEGVTITSETSAEDAAAARTSDGETFYVETSKDGTNTKIKIVFNNFVQYESLVGQDIVVTYSATLNEKAKVDETANKNEVELVYSNKPGEDSGGEPGTPDEPKPGEVTGKTPKTTTETYSTVLKLKKVDGVDNTKTLTGAKFKITATKKNSIALVNSEIYVEDAQGTFYMLKDGTYTETAPVTTEEGYTADKYDDTTKKYKKVTVVTKETVPDTQTFQVEGYVKSDGTLTFTGLSEGEYEITELVAPTGYNLLTDPIKVGIDYSYDAAASKITWLAPEKLTDNSTENPVTYNTTSKAFEIDIENNKGAGLPETGGIGTTIFYVIGAILVLGAGVVMVTRRRMDA